MILVFLNKVRLFAAGERIGLDEAAFRASADFSGVHLAGWTFGTLPGQTSTGDADSFVRKYDPSGEEVWTLQFGTGGLDRSNALGTYLTDVFAAGNTSGAFPGFANAGSADVFTTRILATAPAELIAAAVRFVETLGLPHGTETALVANLAAARRAVARSNDRVATKMILVFLNKVRLFAAGERIGLDEAASRRDRRRLAPIPPARRNRRDDRAESGHARGRSRRLHRGRDLEEVRP
jgi:hypothetical protein